VHVILPQPEKIHLQHADFLADPTARDEAHAFISAANATPPSASPAAVIWSRSATPISGTRSSRPRTPSSPSGMAHRHFPTNPAARQKSSSSPRPTACLTSSLGRK
jgi:hypothetical protein